MYRESAGLTEVFLVHPGGPLWSKKDDGAWSIPKGEFSEGEDPLEAARREFAEETGFPVVGECSALDPIKQSNRKIVHAWAVQGDVDAGCVRSNTFSMEWPPRSGKISEYPEVDRAGWFRIESAKRKILSGQAPLLDQLEQRLKSNRSSARGGPNV